MESESEESIESEENSFNEDSIESAISEEDDEVSKESQEFTTKKEKRRKPGIIYLSFIPSNMNVLKIREYFSKFGQLGRIYLQEKSVKRSKRTQYSEGWIEFKSKRKAKYVHINLNNQPVGGKKTNPDFDNLWNIKYLPRFRWEYLTQRLEYERQVFRKRLGAEISQVNKETDHYLKATMVSKRKAKENKDNDIGFVFKQKLTDEEIRKNKADKNMDAQVDKKEYRKLKNEKYKKLIQRKKKKKEELKMENANNDDDLITSIFVGAVK